MQVRRGGARILAHRFVWGRIHGPIPDGLWVLHRCDVGACINVEHLYLGTPKQNVQDRQERGEWPMHSACRKGHPFTPDNELWSNGQRRCRTCNHAWRKGEAEGRDALRIA